MEILMKTFKNLRENFLKIFSISFLYLLVIYLFVYLKENYFENTEILELNFLIIFVLFVIFDLALAKIYVIVEKNEKNFKFFSKDFFMVLKLSSLKFLKLFLWSFLLFIPSIYKYYEYKNVIFLKINEKNLTTKECFEKSKEQMKNKKLHLFLIQILTIFISIILNFAFFSFIIFLSEFSSVKYLVLKLDERIVGFILIFIFSICHLMFPLFQLLLDVTFNIELTVKNKLD